EQRSVRHHARGVERQVHPRGERARAAGEERRHLEPLVRDQVELDDLRVRLRGVGDQTDATGIRLRVNQAVHRGHGGALRPPCTAATAVPDACWLPPSLADSVCIPGVVNVTLVVATPPSPPVNVIGDGVTAPAPLSVLAKVTVPAYAGIALSNKSFTATLTFT